MNWLTSFILHWINTIIYIYKSVFDRPTYQSADELVKIYKKKYPEAMKQKRMGLPSKIEPHKNHVKRLSSEVLLLIFNELDCDRRDLFNCLLVSKNWYNLVAPLLWRMAIPNAPVLKQCAAHLAHQHVALDLSTRFLIHPRCRNYGKLVKSIDLTKIAEQMTDCQVKYIAQCCPNLTEINLSHCNKITDRSLYFLAKFSLKLESVQMNFCSQITANGLNQLNRLSLKSLHFSNNYISDESTLNIVQPTLKNLILFNCKLSSRNFKSVIANSPNLEYLNISNCNRIIRHSNIEFLANQCKKLQRLCISKQIYPTPMAEFIDYTNSPHQSVILPSQRPYYLQHLIFRAKDQANTNTIQLIVATLSQLAYLDITNWKKISSKNLKNPSIEIIH